MRSLALLLALVALLLAPSAASAQDDPVETGGIVRVVGGGTDGLIAGPDLRGSNAPTLYERTGYTSLYLVSWEDPGFNPIAQIKAVGAALAVSMSSIMLGIANMFVAIATALMGWAFAPTLADPVLDSVTSIVDLLKPIIYTPWIPPMVVFGLVWVAFRLFSRRGASEALSGFAWMVAAVAGGVVLLANPGGYLGTANDATAALATNVLSVVGNAGTEGTGSPGWPDEATYAGEQWKGSVRGASDGVFRALSVTPWAVTQFGSAEAAQQYGYRYLDAVYVDESELAGRNRDEVVEEHEAELSTLLTNIRDNDPETWSWLTGENSGSQFGVALLAWVVAFLFFLIIGGVAVTLIALQFTAIFLVAVFPMMAVFMVWPGRWGRKLTEAYFGALIGTFVKRIGIAVVLSILLVIFQILLATSDEIGWFMSLALSVIAAGAGMSAMWKVSQMLGGDGGRSSAGGGLIASTIGRTAVGRATGAVLGSVTAGATAGAIAADAIEDRGRLGAGLESRNTPRPAGSGPRRSGALSQRISGPHSDLQSNSGGGPPPFGGGGGPGGGPVTSTPPSNVAAAGGGVATAIRAPQVNPIPLSPTEGEMATDEVKMVAKQNHDDQTDRVQRKVLNKLKDDPSGRQVTGISDAGIVTFEGSKPEHVERILGDDADEQDLAYFAGRSEPRFHDGKLYRGYSDEEWARDIQPPPPDYSGLPPSFFEGVDD